MSGSQNASATIASLERLRQAAFEWLTTPADKANENIGVELRRTLVVSRRAVAFGATSLIFLLLALAIFRGLAEAVLVGLVVAVALFWRYNTIVGATKASDDPVAIRAVVEAGLFYSAAISLAGVAATTSGAVVLLVLGALVVTGLVFGFCITNSGAPRYASLQSVIVMVPFIVSAGLSGSRDMWMVFVHAPIWVWGVVMLIGTSHARLAGLIKAQMSSRFLAYNDALTGLANRAQVMNTLQHLARRNEERRKALPHYPPYLLYLDLDGFKGVNDAHGHAAGDALLQAVAQRLKDNVRAGDLVGRLGGDEFVLILENYPPEEIGSLSERLILAIADPFALPENTEAHIGVSIGGAPLGEDPQLALARADSMLYRAKNRGRGTHVLMD